MLRKVAIPALWLLCLTQVVWNGQKPNPYLIHVRNIPPPHPYPTGMVVVVGIVLTLHALLLYAILRPGTYRYSWGRALGAFGVSMVVFCFGAVLGMHAPPAYGPFAIWLFFWPIVTLVLALVSSVGARRHRRATKQGSSAQSDDQPGQETRVA